MNRQAKVTIFVRHILISLLLIPILMFFLPPSMELRLYFHGLTQEGTVNVYRSDDAVGYYFRSVFRVGPSTTSAYMKGVYENLEEFRVRFSDLDEITIDSMAMNLYGLRIAELSGKQMAEKMAVKKGVTIANDTQQASEGWAPATSNTVTENGTGNPAEDFVKLKIAYDGAYFVLQPQIYMHAGAWTYYFVLLLLFALLVAVPVTGILFLIGASKPISEVLFFAMPAFAVSFGELACGSISAMPTKLFFLNYFAVLGIAVFLRFLTRRSFSTSFTGVIFCCIYIANHFVYLFRGRPLLPWDLQAAGTAAEVAGAYDFEMNERLIALILVAVFLFAAPKLLKLKKLCRFDTFGSLSSFATKIYSLQYLSLKNKEPDIVNGTAKNDLLHLVKKISPAIILIRVCGMTAGILMIVAALKSPSYAGLSAKAWDASIIINYQKQGMPMTFVKYMDVYRVSEPDGYGDEILEEIAATYGSSELSDQKYYLPQDAQITTKPQRILMVMNESLSEISYANEEETVDTLPFLRSLTEGTIRGSLYVSVRGGGTCNTEFESLTASSMGLLPPNTYPYEAYIKRETQSLATYFASEGYQVAAFHPADRKNWKRNAVYPLLGLEPFHAYDSFKEIETLRGYATDAWDYEKLTELDAEMGEDPHFIYNVTMQNHGGYSLTDDMQVTADLSEYGDFEQAEVYYSLMKLSDEALRDLISHYQKDETDTMIVIYGDHQPSLGTKTDDFLFDEDPSALVKYETPFVIWANYELPTVEGYSMSANYLPGLVLEAAGFELTPYLRLVGACYEKYPVITSYGVLGADGSFYEDADAIPDDSGVLLQYRAAQYNNLFDSDRMDGLFENPKGQ